MYDRDLCRRFYKDKQSDREFIMKVVYDDDDQEQKVYYDDDIEER